MPVPQPLGNLNPLDLRNGFYGQGVPAATQGYGAYGTIPQLPDPTSTAAFATQGNINNLGNIGALGAGLTGISARDALAQYTANLPNYMAMTNKATSNALSDLAGVVPDDVIKQLVQQAAERGVATGTSYGPNANAAYLKALGLTSLDLQGRGANELSTLVKNTPTGPQFNPSSVLVTPEQEQAAASGQAIYNAAPNPDAAAAAARRLIEEGLLRGGGGAPSIDLGRGGPTIPPIRPPPEPPGPTSGGALGTPTTSGGNRTWINPDGTRTTIKPDGTVVKTAGTAGPNPMQGPNINPSTGGFVGGFQGPAINPATGAASGGFQGPAINPFSGGFSGGYQGPAINSVSGGVSGGFYGPAIDPWSGGFSGGYEGPSIDPYTGEYTGGVTDPYEQFDPSYDYWLDQGSSAGAGDWWNSPDPYSALSGMDWLDYGNSGYSDPYETYDPNYDYWLDDYSGYSEPSYQDNLAYYYGDEGEEG